MLLQSQSSWRVRDQTIVSFDIGAFRRQDMAYSRRGMKFSDAEADKRTGNKMSTPMTTFGETVWVLPPLILHPFNERVPPSTLLDNSKAALMLSGLIPSDGSDEEELKRRLLAGRYSEIRMLFFLGKDVFRWLDQCMEWAERVPELAKPTSTSQSFAGLLTGGRAGRRERKADALGSVGLCVDLFPRHRAEHHVPGATRVRLPGGGVFAQLPSLCGRAVPVLPAVSAASHHRVEEFRFRVVRLERVLPAAGSGVGGSRESRGRSLGRSSDGNAGRRKGLQNRSIWRSHKGQVRTGNGARRISSVSQSWPRFWARVRRVMATRWGVSFLEWQLGQSTARNRWSAGS